MNLYANGKGVGTAEMEDEWENASHHSNPYSNPELEDEWEANYSNPYSNPELENEGELFFGKGFRRFIRKAAKIAAPLAKRLAPIAAKALVGMIPGVGAVAAPLASKLVSTLLQEGEMEAAQMEAEFFGTNEAEAEVGHTEAAHEAALAEMLAAQAAEAASEAEAEAAISAALPVSVAVMRGRRALRRVMPILTQANARLVIILLRQGPAGRQLLRTIPTIQRRTVATLRAAARSGQPVTGPLAVRTMAAVTRRVLSDPRTVQRAIARNAVLRQRVAPPNPRRAAAAGAGRCPVCATSVSTAR